MKKNNNKGFSYIEMLVVIGIMAIVVGVMAMSINLANNTNVSKAADRMASAFNRARTNALTKGTDKGWVNVIVKNGCVYACVGEQITTLDMANQNWEKISDRRLTYSVTGPAIAEGEFRYYHFSQATGGLTPEAVGSLSVIFSHGSKTCRVVVDAYTGNVEKQ